MNLFCPYFYGPLVHNLVSDAYFLPNVSLCKQFLFVELLCYCTDWVLPFDMTLDLMVCSSERPFYGFGMIHHDLVLYNDGAA